MKAKKLGEEGVQTHALVFGSGDDVMPELLEFVRHNRITAAQFSGIGGLANVVLGFFDLATKQYRRIPIDEQVEVVSLLGDVAMNGAEPMLHAHVVVGRADGSAGAGHLLEARVSPTLEVILVQSPRYLRRRMDETTGLPLLDVDL